MLPRSTVWALLVAATVPAFAAAQNIPPVARAAASPDEPLVGQRVTFTSRGSVDPDEMPEPLTVSWDLGDGTPSRERDPVRAFAAPGAYRALLTVGDGAATTEAGVTVYVLAPPTRARPTSSQPLAFAEAGRTLWVANPDSGTVTVIDTASLSRVAEVRVGREPRSVAASEDGARLYVACAGSDELWVLDAASRRVVRTVRTGHAPVAVAAVPGAGAVLVSNESDDTVTVFRPDLEPAAVVGVGDGPRALAITADGLRAYVTHFLSRGAEGTVSVLDLTTNRVERAVGLAVDPGPDSPSSGRGVPNLLGAVAVEPSGLAVWVGGLKSNTGRGSLVDGHALTPENRVRGMFARIDAATGAEDARRRIDANNADSVTGIAFSPAGRFAYVLHQGLGAMSVYDLSAATLYEPGRGSTVPFAARLTLGDAPQGIVVSPDGQRAYVMNFASRSVSVVDLANPRAPAVRSTIATTDEALPRALANGQRLFYRSTEPVHSRGGYVACASCHPGGGHDGRTWDFTQSGEGLRNTIDLRGRGGATHGPVHWSANFDEVQDFENDIVSNFGGTGLAQDGRPPNPPLGAPNAGRSQDLDDLAAFVDSLTTPPRSPFRSVDGSLTATARRGRALFVSDVLQCARCHAPPRYADGVRVAPENYVLHDVGTLGAGSGQRLGSALAGLATPSLAGLWTSAPYLHDGSAATLSDVITGRNASDRHGVTSRLSATDREDLIAFLLSADGTDDTPPVPPDTRPPPASGCRCAAPPGSRPRGWVALVASALAAARRRRRGSGARPSRAEV